jgi:hypothetical protein
MSAEKATAVVYFALTILARDETGSCATRLIEKHTKLCAALGVATIH